jgi:glycosyltransferase involved in cell wall biosynthesis
MNPKVSVVIPTYNRSDKVRKGVESVLAQSFTDLEVIVVDDGSSDNTEQTLRQAFGDRIRYYFQPNQGVSVARNKGIAEARGEWIAFLDSDDLWEREKIERQFNALQQCGSPCGACYTDVRFFNHSETRTMFQLAQNSYRHESTMGVNTDVPRRHGCLSVFIAGAQRCNTTDWRIQPRSLVQPRQRVHVPTRDTYSLLLRQLPARAVRPIASGYSPRRSAIGMEQGRILVTR